MLLDTIISLSAFSPRARGCSGFGRCSRNPQYVFPACAGMFRPSTSSEPGDLSFPRVRGDVPSSRRASRKNQWFSPRARGCSDLAESLMQSYLVFPACAGMFRHHQGGDRRPHRFPRVRGDVPSRIVVTVSPSLFSPRARGCSEAAQGLSEPFDVFPACAGMFLEARTNDAGHRSFPRVRGDVPDPGYDLRGAAQFSPRARGCSSYPAWQRNNATVFPACAGMFRIVG